MRPPFIPVAPVRAIPPDEPDQRLALFPHLGERIDLVATIADFRSNDGRPPFFALLRRLRFKDGRPASDHAWTVWNGALFRSGAGVGDEIAMSARVAEYRRRDGSVDYGIEDLAKVRPALTLPNGTDVALIARAAKMLKERASHGEVAVRNADDPRLQAAMLARFHADSDRYGRLIKVELGPAVAIFMLTNSAAALGLDLEEYVDSLAGAGAGKSVLSAHLGRLEQQGDAPLVLNLRAASEREVTSQRSAEANLEAGRNVLDTGDDDEVAFHKLNWLRGSGDSKARLLASRAPLIIHAAGVVGALAAWRSGDDADASNRISNLLSSTGPISREDRERLARSLTGAFGRWLQVQRRNARRRSNDLKSRAPREHCD